MFYAVLYDHGSMSRFMGYSSNEYTAKLYADSDELSNLYVERFDCGWNEFCDIINNQYSDECVDSYEDQLQIMNSNDGETFLIGSPKGIEFIVYESGFIDTLIERLADSLMCMVYLSEMLHDKDISKFVQYILRTKYPPLAKAYEEGLLSEYPNYHMDLIKALATSGFIGTVK